MSRIVCWPICISDDREKLIVYEEWSGTRGSNYFYVLHKDTLVPISKYFAGKTVFVSRGGRKRIIEYMVSLDKMCINFAIDDKVYLYEFSYSNKGYGPYPTMYVIDCVRRNIVERKSIDLSQVPMFEVLGPELWWVNQYQRYVPTMISRIKNIATKLGFNIVFPGHAQRLADAYKDPRLALVESMTVPSWQGRQKSLEAVIRCVHELYVATLIAEALNAKTISGWYIKYASDYPTAILETNDKKYTLWFQFSLLDWLSIVATKMFGMAIGRLYVRPDIVLFEGEYRSRKDLESNPPRKAVVIDAKISFTDEDLKQLEGYVQNFRQFFKSNIVYIVVFLERSTCALALQQLGYMIVEDTNPYGKGEQVFKDIIRKIVLSYGA